MLLSIKSLQLFYLALAAGFASAVTNNDFIALKVKLKEYIAQQPDRHIPLLVRASFHDLFLNDKATMQGCLANSAFVNNRENVGLDTTMSDLQAIIRNNFPATGFTFGDVIAFAGKVAAESAYPCMKIPFKFNRSTCSLGVPITNNEAPSAFLDTIDQLSDSFNYMGGSITAQDMAILFAGAHGIKGARAGPTGWFGVFSTFSSGKEFIAKTFRESWKFIAGSRTLAQFFTGGPFDRQTSIIRLPSDMMFYPSKIPDGFKNDTSPEAAAIEAQLRGFTTQDRSVFDQEFERAYGKLLAIGDANQDFVDDTPTQVCPDINGPPPSSTSTRVPPKTTAIVITTSTKVPPSSSSNDNSLQTTDVITTSTKVPPSSSSNDNSLQTTDVITTSTKVPPSSSSNDNSLQTTDVITTSTKVPPPSSSSTAKPPQTTNVNTDSQTWSTTCTNDLFMVCDDAVANSPLILLSMLTFLMY